MTPVLLLGAAAVRGPRLDSHRRGHAAGMATLTDDPAFLWPGHVSRSVSFEDATTSRGRKESLVCSVIADDHHHASPFLRSSIRA